VDLASPVSRLPLVGRDHELSLLRPHLAAALAGNGSLVLISGEAGVGKTALAHTLCAAAADTGALTFTGHCYDRTETPPYGPWIEIAQHFRSFPLAAHAPAVPSLDTATSQEDLFAQIRDFLVAVSADRPMLLLLEDLHWADSASLDLLRFLARALASLPLLLLVTYRADELDRRHPLHTLVPLLVREAPIERLDLRPLDTDAAGALVRATFALADDEATRFARYLVARTEGNALFITELLRTIAEDPHLAPEDGHWHIETIAQAPVPRLLEQIIESRLARLGDEADAQLAVAAVIGQEVPLAVWQAVTEEDEERLLTIAERAEEAHLVAAWPSGAGIGFTHALIREVLYENVPALRRRRLHRQVGEALVALLTPDPDAVAYHLQQAGDERAAAWLVRAAERAEDAYALVTAVERYEAAMRLLDVQHGDAGERGWLRLITAALRRHDDLDQALAWVEAALELAATAEDPSLSARAQALHGLLLGYRGDYRGAMVNMTAAIDKIDHLPQESDLLRRREQQIDKVVNRGTLIAVLAHGGHLTEARRQGEIWLARFADAATTPAEFGAIADARMALAMAYAFQGEPVLSRRTYAAGNVAYLASDNHVFALVNLREELILAVLPYQADDLTERERVAAAAERMAEWVVNRGGHVNSNLPKYARIPLLVLEGQWREARRILEPPDTPDFTLTGRVRTFYLGTLARAQGDTETAWQCVYEPWRTSPDAEPGERFTPLPLPFQLLAARLALDAGDLDATRGWLDLHRRWLDFMDATLGRSEEAALEAEWHRATGGAARARAYAEQALAHATHPRQPLALLAAHRLLGELDIAVRRFDPAHAHLAEALALADACRAPYERALTLLAHAELAAAQGSSAAVTSLIEEVRAICVPLDARLALDQADRLATRRSSAVASVTPTSTFPAGLTAREVEVLRLLAVGVRNATIAERLSLRPNTVKVHVGNIFAKLGVSNRAAATRFAVDHDLV
jgi:DNA-binding CsgD family transcriptional regulator